MPPSKNTLKRFEREYQAYHKLSKNRRWEQTKTLKLLLDHAGKPALEDIESSDIRAFLSDLLDDGEHPNTVTKKLGMIKPWFGWAWEAKLIDGDRLMGVQRIKRPRGARPALPKPYSRKEIGQFWDDLATAWPEASDLYWQRWRNGTSRYSRIAQHAMRIELEAIVALALHCGLRRQEIFNASIDDIHYDNAYVVVRYAKDHENGGKFREVPHTEFSRNKVERWLELRTELAPSHQSPWLSLAPNQPDGNWLNPMSAERFSELMRTVGPWELHRFRHTCGTEWLRAIGRLEIVSRLLGHATVQQTLGYAEIMRDDLHEAVGKAEAAFTAALTPKEKEPA